MMNVNNLLDNGFKTYRRLSGSKWNRGVRIDFERCMVKNPKYRMYNGDLLVDFEFNNKYKKANFNALENGGLAVYFIKDMNMDEFYIYALTEQNKEPNLIKYDTKEKNN